MSDRLFLFTAVFLLLGAVCISVVGLVSQEWTLYKILNFDVDSGLWRLCREGHACVDQDASSDLDTTIGLLVTGIALASLDLVVAVVACGCVFVNHYRNTSLYVILSGLCTLAMTFTLAAVLYYEVKVHEDMEDVLSSVKHGHGFWLATSSILLFVAALFFFIMAGCSREDRPLDDDNVSLAKSDTAPVYMRPRQRYVRGRERSHRSRAPGNLFYSPYGSSPFDFRDSYPQEYHYGTQQPFAIPRSKGSRHWNDEYLYPQGLSVDPYGYPMNAAFY